MAPTGETRTWRLLGLVGLANAVAVLSSPEALINPIGEWVRRHQEGFSAASVTIPSLAQVLLVPLVAVLSDRVQLAGGRRRGWLLLSALAAAACWWKFDPAGTSGISTPIGTAVLLFLAQAALAIAGGLAVDVAVPAARTGAAVAIGRVGVFVAFVAAAALGPLLDEGGTHATTRLIAGAFALLAVAVVVLGKEGPPTSRSYDTKVRPRGYWGCVLILLWIEGLGHISTFAFGARNAAGAAAPAGLVPALALLVACVYFALARSMTPSRLPTLAFALGVACTLATIGRAILPFPMAQVTTPLLVGAAWLPTVDVGMRFVRRESAALGFWLLLAVPRFVSTMLAMPLLMRLGPLPVPASAVAGLSLGLLVVGALGWRLSGRAVAAAP